MKFNSLDDFKFIQNPILDNSPHFIEFYSFSFDKQFKFLFLTTLFDFGASTHGLKF